MTESDYVVLWSVSLGSRHMETGHTVHHRDGKILQRPKSLRIAQYPDDGGYYLFYLDENYNELTDTYHDDVASAMAQAEWEFGVKAADWARVA